MNTEQTEGKYIRPRLDLVLHIHPYNLNCEDCTSASLTRILRIQCSPSVSSVSSTSVALFCHFIQIPISSHTLACSMSIINSRVDLGRGFWLLAPGSWLLAIQDRKTASYLLLLQHHLSPALSTIPRSGFKSSPDPRPSPIPRACFHRLCPVIMRIKSSLGNIYCLCTKYKA